MTKLEELRDAYGLATEKVRDLETEMKAEIAKARQGIEEAFKERRIVASQAQREAFAAQRAEENRLIELKAANHPLAGRKVSAVRQKRNSRWRNDTETQFGLIEVITENSEQPERRGYYSKLSRGTVAVRHLSSTGRPLKTVEQLVTRDDQRERFKTSNSAFWEGLSADEQEERLEKHWQLVD